MKHYLIAVAAGVSSELLGPFKDDQEQEIMAVWTYAHQNRATDSLFLLDIDAAGVPRITDFDDSLFDPDLAPDRRIDTRHEEDPDRGGGSWCRACRGYVEDLDPRSLTPAQFYYHQDSL